MEFVLLKLIFWFSHTLSQFFNDLGINPFMRHSGWTEMATLMGWMVPPTLVAKVEMAAGTEGYIWSYVVAKVARDVVSHDEGDDDRSCVSDAMRKW
jgi:hypothetical protein